MNPKLDRSRRPGRRKGERLVLSAMAVVVVASVGGAAHAEFAQGLRTFTMTSLCEGFQARLAVDAATVRSEGRVPPEFRFRGEDSGLTDIAVGAFECRDVTIDSRSSDPFEYSLLNVFLDNRTGPAQGVGGSYDVWQFLDSADFHRQLSAFGVWNRLLDDMSVTVDRLGGVPVSGHANIPWPESPHVIDAVFPATVPLPEPPLASDHWFSGPYGPVHAHHDNNFISIVPAQLSIDTTAGTPLARVLGGDVLAAPGVYFEFTAVATWRITEPTASADLSLVKTGPSHRVPTGRDFTYTLTVGNDGPDPAPGVLVTDALPGSVSFVSATPTQGSCAESELRVTCEVETVASGATAVVEIVVRPIQPGTITNTASVASFASDTDPSNDSDSVDTSVCRLTSRRSSIPCG